MNKALFLDLDGTVRGTKGNKMCPNKPEEQYVLPGRKEVIQSYKGKGFKIIAVTNQGGIGLGYMTEAMNASCLADLNRQLDHVFDDMLWAPAPPKEKHKDTKPNPGMITRAEKKHSIDLTQSIMVGDRPTDKQAAENAGVKYIDAKEFFSDEKTYGPER